MTTTTAKSAPKSPGPVPPAIKAQSSGRNSLAIGAAAGLVAGLAANFVRKAAVQAPTALAGDWAKALATEHKMTLAVFDKLEATENSQKTKRSMLLMQLKHALSKHALQEENVVYAALRDHGQTEAADRLNHDHGYVKQYLYDLDMMPKNSEAWLSKVHDFRKLLEGHMREEENEIFPAMHAKLSPDANKALTMAMNKEGLKLA
jgi:hemerythrin superfamily protein